MTKPAAINCTNLQSHTLPHLSAGPCRTLDNEISHRQTSAHVEGVQILSRRLDRRQLLLGSATLVCFGAQAAGNGAGAVELPRSVFELFSPTTSPEPVRFPRKQLELHFAVLLLRSTYEAVDALDFIPMDKFQVRFWKLRQSNYEPYLLQYNPLKVRQVSSQTYKTIPGGDLTDPQYFDFISFAQFATISQEIPKGLQQFEEYCEEADGAKRVVKRRPELQDNTVLPAALEEAAGDLIYAGLRDGFRGQHFAGPKPCPLGCSDDQLLYGVQRILDIFVEQGFCVKARLTNATIARDGSTTFTTRLDAPANLWGMAALAARQSSNLNAYDSLAIQAYLRASGRKAVCTVRRSGVAVEEDWTIT